ncbi:MAG: hypothetical protein V4505_24640 [Pseudomonadota bacterium]
MRCPHCSSKIGIFSPAWQSQRTQEARHCPACGTPLELAFGSPRVSFWFASTAIVVLVLLRVLGMPLALALPVAALAAFNAGLFAGMHLRVPSDPAEEDLPPRRLTPWMVVGYFILAVLAFAIFTAGVAIYLPAPWSAMVLLAAGALCLWKRRVQLASLRIGGLAAQTFACGLLAAGGWLLYLYSAVA